MARLDHKWDVYKPAHVNYSLNSLKGIIYGTTIGLIKGDTRSLDYSAGST